MTRFSRRCNAEGMLVQSEWAAVRDSAITTLRAALVSGVGVAEALRQCWYRNPLFGVAVFIEAVRARFRADDDVRLLTAFITRHWPGGGSGVAAFPVREAEALMRSALGEVGLMEDVHPGRFSYPEICIGLLSALFQKWRPGAGEVADLLVRAEGSVRGAHELSSDLSGAEDSWFAAGMHESPFAWWLGDDHDGTLPGK